MRQTVIGYGLAKCRLYLKRMFSMGLTELATGIVMLTKACLLCLL